MELTEAKSINGRLHDEGFKHIGIIEDGEDFALEIHKILSGERYSNVRVVPCDEALRGSGFSLEGNYKGHFVYGIDNTKHMDYNPNSLSIFPIDLISESGEVFFKSIKRY